MFLKAQMHDLLITLDRARLDTPKGEGWVSAHALKHIPVHIRQYAQQKGYVVGRGKTALRQYQITATGRTALAENAEANLAVMDKIENGFVPEGDPIDDLTVVEPAGIINSLVKPPSTALEIVQKNNPAPIAAAPLPPYARACVQVVEILAEDFPEVGDMVEALMKIQIRMGPARD